MEVGRGEYGTGGNVNLSVVFVLFVNLFLNCIPKISRDTFIWKKKTIHITNEYIIFILLLILFICLFVLVDIEMLHKETMEIDADMKCHLFGLKWLIMISFLERC